jgi:hypothetical protein
MISSLFVEAVQLHQVDYLSAIVGIATGYSWSGMGMTLWLILWLYLLLPL